MKPAPAPRPPGARRLLVVEGLSAQVHDARARELPRYLAPGDLLVVNDAATLPAALRGHVTGRDPPERGAPPGTFVEIRLTGALDPRRWGAIVLGAGDHGQRTEDRGPLPLLAQGHRFAFGPLKARVTDVDAASGGRVLTLTFDANPDDLWPALYRAGIPIQYAHVGPTLALWDVQTAYGSRPWAVEAPSAGFALDGETLVALRRRGVEIATVTHAAGLSSTGDAALDVRLPLPERRHVPPPTAAAVAQALAGGHRVVAVGTSVVRALEGGPLPGDDVTDFRVGPGTQRRVVSGLVTGLHDEGTSHFQLLEAFADPALLRRAYAHAAEAGYLGHELGDAALLLSAPPHGV